jgi:hypothetical protein
MGGLIFGLVVGRFYEPITGLVMGLTTGLCDRSPNHITLVETISWSWEQLRKKKKNAILGLLHFGVLGGLTYTVKVGKTSPNQGVKLSLKNFLIVSLFTLLTIGLIGGQFFGPIAGLFFGLMFGLIAGLIAGLTIGLSLGGSAVIKHYALRLTLWLNGHTALNLIKFLDQCAKLIFLKKVGGGYIFIHRMLLEYFAELPQSTKCGDGKTGVVPD